MILPSLRNNKISLLMAIIPSLRIIGIMPSLDIEYYVLLIFCTLYAIANNSRIYVKGFIYIGILALTIFVSNPDPLFKSWSRLIFFTLLLGTTFPLFGSHLSDKNRIKALVYSLQFIVIMSIVSFIFYNLKIDWSTSTKLSYYDINSVGFFGGVTKHSMTLGPIAGLATIYLLWILLTTTKRRFIIAILGAVSLFTCFISASRGATVSCFAGIIILVFHFYGRKASKIIKVLFLVSFVAVSTYPIYKPYLDNVMAKQTNNVSGGGSTFMSRENKWDNRMDEFYNNPIFGCGFSALDINNRVDYNPKTGSIEPGTSWLAVLSMTGIIGALALAIIILPTLFKLMVASPGYSSLLCAVLILFIVHMIVEGYIFAAGDYLCYMFWLVLGCCIAYNITQEKYITQII